jgi:hypothetical protein
MTDRSPLADLWAWRSDANAPAPNLLAPQGTRPEMRPGPTPTLRDRVFDYIYGALGGTPSQRSTASALTDLADFATLGVPTALDQGVRDVAAGQGPFALGMALVPGAKLGSSAAQAAARSAAQSDMIKHLAPSKWYKGRMSAIITPQYAPVEYSQLRLDDSGRVILQISDKYSSVPDLKVFDPKDRMHRLVDKFLWPYGEDVYLRGAIGRADYNYLSKGAHRGSINHATGVAEDGLSVAHRLEPGDSYKRYYFVKGERIGTGSDGEPILNARTARPITDPAPSSKIIDKLIEDEMAYAASKGLTKLDVSALRDAIFQAP